MILINTCLRRLILATSLYLNRLPSSHPLVTFPFFTITNIRSFSLHHDELVYLSAHTNLNLDVIGVSEIWHSNDNPISTNVDIPGYTLFKTSSLTQNGGVGLYIRNSLTSEPRIDLDSCTTDFETVWVEIENKRDKDFLIWCVDRQTVLMLITPRLISRIFYQKYFQTSCYL